MGDKREVGEVSLDVLIENDGRFSVAQWRAILIEQVHELLGDHPIRMI